MVEGQALYEWSPEVALALSTRFCSWVVAEEDAEHHDDHTEDSKALVHRHERKQRASFLVPRNGALGSRAASSNSLIPTQQQDVRSHPSNEQENSPKFASHSMISVQNMEEAKVEMDPADVLSDANPE